MRKVSMWLLVICLGISIMGISGLANAQKEKERVERDIVVRTQDVLRNIFFQETSLGIETLTINEIFEAHHKAKRATSPIHAVILLQRMVFEATHPRIELRSTHFKPIGSEQEKETKLFTAIAEGTAPSFLEVSSKNLLHYANEGIIADITDYVKKWEAYEYLPKSWWDFGRIKGRVYAFPTRRMATKGVTYRKDYFKEVGIFNEKGLPAPPDNWTVEDFTRIAQKLTDTKKNRWGWVVWGDFSPQDFFSVFGNFFVKPDKSGKYTWRAAFDLPAKRWFEWIKDMKWNKKCIIAGPDIDWDFYIFKSYFAGRVGMGCRSSIHMPVYLYAEDVWTYFGPDVDPRKDLGIAPPPAGPEGLRVKTPVEPGMIGINGVQSKEQIEASLEFARWLLEEPFSYQLLGITKVQLDKEEYYEHGVATIIYQSQPEAYHYPDVEGLETWAEKFPKDFTDTFKKCFATPTWPLNYSYGCPVPQDAINNRLRPVYEAVVTNPNCDIEKELARAETLVNGTVLNYKDEEVTKENLKTYYTALGDFYKENYAEYYDKWYKKLYEEVFKVW